MWPRVVEAMLGVWLALSPFIFHHPSSRVAWWAVDFSAAFLVFTFSLLCFWHRARRARFASLAVALFLMGWGYFASSHPPPPADENRLMVGLLLVMLTIIPSEASKPPVAWRKFYADRLRTPT